MNSCSCQIRRQDYVTYDKARLASKSGKGRTWNPTCNQSNITQEESSDPNPVKCSSTTAKDRFWLLHNTSIGKSANFKAFLRVPHYSNKTLTLYNGSSESLMPRCKHPATGVKAPINGYSKVYSGNLLKGERCS